MIPLFLHERGVFSAHSRKRSSLTRLDSCLSLALVKTAPQPCYFIRLKMNRPVERPLDWPCPGMSRTCFHLIPNIWIWFESTSQFLSFELIKPPVIKCRQAARLLWFLLYRTSSISLVLRETAGYYKNLLLSDSFLKWLRFSGMFSFFCYFFPLLEKSKHLIFSSCVSIHVWKNYHQDWGFQHWIWVCAWSTKHYCDNVGLKHTHRCQTHCETSPTVFSVCFRPQYSLHLAVLDLITSAYAHARSVYNFDFWMDRFWQPGCLHCPSLSPSLFASVSSCGQSPGSQ